MLTHWSGYATPGSRHGERQACEPPGLGSIADSLSSEWPLAVMLGVKGSTAGCHILMGNVYDNERRKKDIEESVLH